jgi:Sec-independent protein translocase protein TatA
MSATLKLIVAAVVLALLGALGYGIHEWGASSERLKTVTSTAKANDQVEKKQKAKTRSDLTRSAQTGAAREQDRASLDALFQRLEREAKDAPSAAHDSYVLPDDRLQLWRAANAGPGRDRGQATGEPHVSAEGAAAAALGTDRGPGGQPQAGGKGLSRPGVADVPVAGVPATANRGL